MLSFKTRLQFFFKVRSRGKSTAKIYIASLCWQFRPVILSSFVSIAVSSVPDFGAVALPWDNLPAGVAPELELGTLYSAVELWPTGYLSPQKSKKAQSHPSLVISEFFSISSFLHCDYILLRIIKLLPNNSQFVLLWLLLGLRWWCVILAFQYVAEAEKDCHNTFPYG